MSGFVPKKVRNARVRTKTNQPGLKMQGSASMLGRRNFLKRSVNRRVQTTWGLCGHPTGYRCMYCVDPETASKEARDAYCYKASDVTEHSVCIAEAPKNQGLAGGVGRINAPGFKCNKNCSISDDHPHLRPNPPGPRPGPGPSCQGRPVNHPDNPKMVHIGCSDGGTKQKINFSWDRVDVCVKSIEIFQNTKLIETLSPDTTSITLELPCNEVTQDYKYSIRSVGVTGAFSIKEKFDPEFISIGCLPPNTPTGLACSPQESSSDAIVLYWDENDPSPSTRCTTTYTIQYKLVTSTQDPSSTTIDRTPGIFQRGEIHDLDANTEYEFRVRANNGNGSSDYTAYIKCTPKPAPVPATEKISLGIWHQANGGGTLWGYTDADNNTPRSSLPLTTNSPKKVFGNAMLYYISWAKYMNDKLSAAGGALDKITLVIEDPALLTNKYLRFKSNSEPVGATSDGLNPPKVPVNSDPAFTWYASDPYNNPNNPNPEHVYHAPHVNPKDPDATQESTNLSTVITQPADLPWIITYFIEVLWNPNYNGNPNPYYMPDIEIGFIMDIGVKDRQWAYYGWQGTKQMSGNSKMGQQYSFPGSQTSSAKDFDPRLADSYYFRGPHGIKLVASAYTNSNGPQDPPAVDSNNNNILFEKVSLGSNIAGYTGTVNPLSVNGTFPVPGVTTAPTQSRNREVNPCPNLYQALHYISDLNLCLTNSTLCPWNTAKRIITIASFDSEGGADGYEGELPLGGNANATVNSGKNPTTQWSPVAPSFNKTIRGTYVGSGNLTNASESDQNTPNRSGITITYPTNPNFPSIQRGFGANCSNQDYVNNLWHAFTSGGVFAGGLPSN